MLYFAVGSTYYFFEKQDTTKYNNLKFDVDLNPNIFCVFSDNLYKKLSWGGSFQFDE